MPQKTFSVVSYAAGVSLAAAALIYVFAPSYFVNGSSAVGLQNQANDCFINSVLQVLAGLDQLRMHLIRETYRRSLGGPDVYTTVAPLPQGAPTLPAWKIRSQQLGDVTRGLKDMLDALNERPISRKVITPSGFLHVLQAAFGQQISRQQQDAQEFLQIVLERLKDELHAGKRARTQARQSAGGGSMGNGHHQPTPLLLKDHNDDMALPHARNPAADISTTETNTDYYYRSHKSDDSQQQQEEEEEKDGEFPFEGKYESLIVCQTCRYQSTPRGEDFSTLTLNVPQVSATHLEACFDMIFKTEFIDDFRCEKCHLVHVRDKYERQLARLSTSLDKDRIRAREAIDRLTIAIETSPEKPPEGVDLGDINDAPRRRIARRTRLVRSPKILAIHLSRSIYDGYSLKNSAKVAFPERLSLGNLFEQREYKLVALVTHRGGHNSGHYESFRRQNAQALHTKLNTPLPPPSAHNQPEKSLTTGSTAGIEPREGRDSSDLGADAPASGDITAAAPEGSSSAKRAPDGSTATADAGSLRSLAASARSMVRRSNDAKRGEPEAGGPDHDAGSGTKTSSKSRGRKKKGAAPLDRWWRISDEKVREARTNEVLNMQREVYLLFYELDGELHGSEQENQGRT